MSFLYARTIRFHDTDAAGVVYFANVLSICHEAYEASLTATGIDLKAFFRSPTIAIPIVHADLDLMRPMFCGESYTVQLQPAPLGNGKFEIAYQLFATALPDQQVGRAKTIHVCIAPGDRSRIDLPPEMQQWLQHMG